MRTLLQQVMGILCLTLIVTSCKKHNDDAIPADPDNAIETKAPTQQPNTASVTTNIQGYYSSVPHYYQYTTKKYPLLISIPGGGQYGNGGSDLPKVLYDGVAQLIDAKKFPPNFTVNGENFSFIVLSPQLKDYPAPAEIGAFISYAEAHYRIDSSRIYVTGLSVGGEAAGDAAGSFPLEIAAIAPMSGESKSAQASAAIASNNIPVWDFHNSGDTVVNISESNNFIAMINSHSPAIPPKQTIFQSTKHDSWTQALNPSYKENNMNVYEWMLHYKK
jgi:predicted peptidase